MIYAKQHLLRTLFAMMRPVIGYRAAASVCCAIAMMDLFKVMTPEQRKVYALRSAASFFRGIGRALKGGES